MTQVYWKTTKSFLVSLYYAAFFEQKTIKDINIMMLYTCISVIEWRRLRHQYNEEDYLQITFQQGPKIYVFYCHEIYDFQYKSL